MKRKQIYIEEEQDEQIKAIARQRGVAEAIVIREAVDAYLSASEYKGYDRMEDHPLWGIVGLIDDPNAPVDGSVNHDHYLYGGPKKYRINEDGSIERIRESRE